MKIHLLSKDKLICYHFKKEFGEDKNGSIHCQEFSKFMDENKNIDCVVSPANSYGLMDGAYDLAITTYFGKELMEVVQKEIITKYNGEQPVASSIIVNIPNSKIKLIHTPTMRIPSIITDPMVIYHSTRSALLLAKQNHIRNIVLPAFGAGTGQVDADIVAHLMKEGINQVLLPPSKINWQNAFEKANALEEYINRKKPSI